jgi:hypothetical protein
LAGSDLAHLFTLNKANKEMNEKDTPQDSTNKSSTETSTKAPSFILRPVVREIEENMRGEYSQTSILNLWERLQKICFDVCIFFYLLQTEKRFSPNKFESRAVF